MMNFHRGMLSRIGIEIWKVCVCVRVRVDGKINPSRADPGSLHSQKTQLKTEPTWKPEHIKELICKTIPQH